MNEITKFFESFSNDFSDFSGVVIAERYLAPFLAISSDGDLKYLEMKDQIAEYFQSYLNDYKSQGITTCEFRDLEYFQLGESAYAAIVTWILKDQDDNCVISWRESYNLIKRQNGLFVYSSADFK